MNLKTWSMMAAVSVALAACGAPLQPATAPAPEAPAVHTPGPPPEGADWSAPNRLFHLAFPEGWGVEAVAAAPSEVLVHFNRADQPGAEKQCFIQARAMPLLDGRDQIAVNAGVARWGQPEVVLNVGGEGLTRRVIDFDSSDVGAVRVASALIAVEGEGVTHHFYTRQFVLAEPDGARFYALHCLVMNPRPGGADDVEALIDSLAFTL